MILTQRSITRAKTRGKLPITRADVRGAVQAFGAARRLAAEPFLNALHKVRGEQSLANLSSDVQNALLRDRLVYQYYDDEAGKYWYDVCPLIAPSLEQ
jgi:hypothetical protein